LKRHVVTGGAGFIGSHLCEALVGAGDFVVCVDDFSSGSRANVAQLFASGRFELVVGDVCDVVEGLDGPVSTVAHLASPASPADYLAHPLETLKAGSRGTEAALKLAQAHQARFVLASTSEVYGDPLVHPQPETYWGNVNPVGPRSVYDEAKRFAEALTSAYRRSMAVNTGIVRIFNTYGPRLRPGDGRVVSNFIVQALSGAPLTIYGDGSQTRSLCYVDDVVRGLVAMLCTDLPGPVNLGNPTELSVAAIAQLVLGLTGSSSSLVYLPLPEDDPVRRQPDVGVAKSLLGWEPTTSPTDGIAKTISWFSAMPVLAGPPPGASSPTAERPTNPSAERAPALS
jgi:dTDP-glucose 4,6-dehydratase